MLHTNWRLGPRLRVFSQVLSPNELGRRGGLRPQIDRDIFAVYQAFTELTAPLGSWQAALRVGRQEFLCGSERLLSMREAPNNRQSFDAARRTLMRPGWRLDLLARPPLRTNRGPSTIGTTRNSSCGARMQCGRCGSCTGASTCTTSG